MSKKKPSSKNDNQAIIPLMYRMADMLPKDLRSHGRRIVDFFVIGLLAIFTIFLLGAFVAILTGHSDQLFTIFPTYIYIVGAVIVIAIVEIVKKIIK